MARIWDRIFGGSQRDSGAQRAGASVGYLLGGGHRRDAEAEFDKRYGDLLVRGTKEQDLHQQIMKTDALRGLDESLAAFFDTAEQAAAAGALGRAGLNPEQYTGAAGDLLIQEYRRRAAATPDWNERNALLAAIKGEPVQLAGVDGDTLLANRYVVGGDSRGPTEVGASKIRTQDAMAGNYRDMAAKRMPGGSRASSGGSGGQYTMPATTSLKLALAKPGTDQFGNPTPAELDQAQVRDFQVWRQSNPQYRNGEEALAAYVTQLPSGPGGSRVHIIDPSLPGSLTKGPPARIPAGISYERTPELEALEREIGRKLADWELRDIEQGTFSTTAPLRPEDQQAQAATTSPTRSGGAEATVQLRIQQARDAVARGKDPAAVRQMLGRMGINPAAAGL